MENEIRGEIQPQGDRRDGMVCGPTTCRDCVDEPGIDNPMQPLDRDGRVMSDPFETVERVRRFMFESFAHHADTRFDIATGQVGNTRHSK